MGKTGLKFNESSDGLEKGSFLIFLYGCVVAITYINASHQGLRSTKRSICPKTTNPPRLVESSAY